ncbi:hypothetical protein [Rhizobium sp. NLR22b]|uniref:hypothetical protein n=1 Tax=Rhizobium sp. NLR22b TaxID=2731115 RepID=UPI001C83F269|nr:hypothetical protein [Rhizobium sp. NLR22b]MBX5239512.1 hypothetical protein [Rhizobium sp. NLR22b]
MTNTDINPEKPLRGRRLSWREFTELAGLPKPDYAALPANDNGVAVDEKRREKSRRLFSDHLPCLVGSTSR